MSVVLYNFNCTEAFPVLPSFSSGPGSIDTRVAIAEGDASLMVSLRRDGSLSEPFEAALALPPRTVAGTIERLELALVGDQSGCTVALEAEDEAGVIRLLEFGAVDFEGRGSCVYYWSFREKTQILQLHRVRIVIGPSCATATLFLLSLTVHGHVRSLPTGMAQNLHENAQ